MEYALMAARGFVLLITMLNPSVITVAVSGIATARFAAAYMLQSESPKDAQQDSRMDYMDSRDLREQEDRKEKRVESQAWNSRQDAEIKELSDDIHQLYGWGAGAFAAVTVLQIIGLIKGKTHP